MPPSGEVHPKSEFVLGCDVARLGQDSTVFVVVEKPFDDEDLYVSFLMETQHKLTTDAVNRIVALNQKFNFSKIYVDITGLGSGVYDNLIEYISSYKVEAVTFTSKSKQDMYSNLKRLLEKRMRGEKGALHLPKREKSEVAKKLFYQLADLRYKLKSSRGSTEEILSDIQEGRNVEIAHPPGGHDDFCFVGNTKILTNVGYKKIKNIKVGDKVLTRKGYKKVIAVSKRKENIISKIGLIGTPNHPIITKNGIKKLINVSASDVIYIWNQKLLCIEEKSIKDILTKKRINMQTIFGILSGVTKQLKQKAVNLFIGKFGLITSVKSLKDSLSITKMRIFLITLFPTLSLCIYQNIEDYICQKRNQKKKQGLMLVCLQDQKRLNGINLRKEINGIKNTENGVGIQRTEKKENSQQNVLYVKSQLMDISKIERNFVVLNVNNNTTERIILKRESVLSVIKRKIYTSIQKLFVALKNVLGFIKNKRTVYNLQVDECNEYFANDILVHNCDALALACLYFKDIRVKKSGYNIA